MNSKKTFAELIKIIDSMTEKEKEETTLFYFSLLPVIDGNNFTMAKANFMISGEVNLLANAIYEELFKKPDNKLIKKIFIQRIILDMQNDTTFIDFLNQIKQN